MAPAKGGISQDVGEVGSGGDPGVKETLVKATTRGVRAHTGGHQGVVKRGREVGGSGAVATWAGEKGGSQEGRKCESGSQRGRHLWSVATGQTDGCEGTDMPATGEGRPDLGILTSLEMVAEQGWRTCVR